VQPRSGSARLRGPRAARRRAKQVARRRAIAAVLLAGSAVGFGLFLLLISPLGHSLFERTVPHSALRSAALAERGRARYGLPVRLTIPRLGVDAAVEDVGLTPDGAMGVPGSPGTVAWFKLGPRPGDKGSAVIDGHSGYGSGAAAVFDDLPSLRKGDLLFVEDGKGVLVRFVVRTSRMYDRDANASDVFGRNEGRHLNLVTCTGAWDAAAGTHAQRLVVFTDALP
jgi:LPXTG-site transpeptidase (sortase) family protein